MKLNCVKVNNSQVACIVPYGEQDREDFDRIPYQAPFQVEVKKRRNPRFHDKFMKLCRIVYENSERWASVEALLMALKYQLGLVDIIEGLDGQNRLVPRSISFEKMDDFEFEYSVYRPSLPLLAREIGVTAQELEGQI